MQIAIDRILAMKELGATSLLVAGHANLLIEHEATAEGYYEEVRALKAWEQKTDYYISTFCYEFKRYEQALNYANKALELSPNDSSVRFHLSLCYSALGQSKNALEALKAAEDSPEWLKYYRFTLERDAGHEDVALNTLLNIPSDYFQDPNELEQALEFAKHTQDLQLLRHLKRKE
jgi:tetratricopeptide (TPR) repeat protein